MRRPQDSTWRIGMAALLLQPCSREFERHLRRGEEVLVLVLQVFSVHALLLSVCVIEID